MSAITIDTNLVHYEVLGRGRPVIFLHGWLGSWRYWIPTMQQLSIKYRCYALDLWGFGDTEKDSARYSFAAQVKLVTDFMDKMGIAKAAVVGHGLGAAVAITFARQFPERAPRMMLISPPLFDLGSIEPAPPPRRPIAPPPQAPSTAVDSSAATIPRNPFRSSPDRLAELQELAAAQGITGPSVPSPRPAGSPDPLAQPAKVEPVNPLVNLLLTMNPRAALERNLGRNPENLEKLRAEVDKMDPNLLTRLGPTFAGVNLALQLLQLNSPVLLLHGEDDTMVPVQRDLVEKIGNIKPNGMFMPFIVPDFRYFPMLEHTTQFNRLLVDFLDAPDLTNIQLKETWRRQLR
jgi:pimeloyl-ACP methyl ester carboxylesterase